MNPLPKALNKERAMAALLDAATLTEAAERAGLDRKTLYNYLHDEADFAKEFKRQRELRAIEQAEQAAGEREAALQAIRDIMNDTELSGNTRLKAAEKLLDVANRGVAAQMNAAERIWNIHCGFGF